MLTVGTVYFVTDTLNVMTDNLDPVTDTSQPDIGILNRVKDVLQPPIDDIDTVVDILHLVTNVFHISPDALYTLDKAVGDPLMFRSRDPGLFFCQIIQPLKCILNVGISD
jgi:hypothetical protein